MCLLWVDKHDDAYQWARRRSCHINRISGALQVVDVEAAEIAAQVAPTTPANVLLLLLLSAFSICRLYR